MALPAKAKGAQAAEGDPGQAEIRLRERELDGDDDADEHRDESPDEGRQRELADDGVVVFEASEDGDGGGGGVIWR